MKKLYFLFAVLIIGLQAAYSQPFWHSDLGSAPTGTIRLSSAAQSYSFETTGGLDAGYDTDAMQSSLNQQLSAAGFSWITVSFIESQTDEQFTVTVQLSRNASASSRSVYFGTNVRRLEILQQAESGNPEPDLPADKVVRVYPGCSETITLRNTNLGQVYSLKTNNVTLKSITGTGGTISFCEVMIPGDYWIENARNSNFTVEYAYPFTLRLDTDIEECTIAANGGVQYVYFSMGWDSDYNELIFSGEEDVQIFEDAFDQYNSGCSENWNSHMKIYYGYDEEAGMCYVRVVSPPNLGSETLHNDSFLGNGNYTHIVFEQNGNGHVNVVDVNFEADRSVSKLNVGISNPQPFVAYSLYKDGTRLVGKTAFVDALTLTAPLSAGRYEVRAEYEDETGRRECKDLKSICFYGDSMAELSGEENWVFSQTFNEQGKHACDVTYYDGLGYPSQEIAIGATDGGSSDLIRPIAYDMLHREARKYLPYSRTNGNGGYDLAAITAQETFYRNKFSCITPYAYTHDEYESSPLNRALKSRKPGAEFQTDAHSVRNTYIGNGSSAVGRLDIDPATGSLHVNGYYEANMLSGTQTTDEDGAVVVTYTDKEGHTVYEERQLRGANNAVDHLITRYVYDDCGRLAWVVTPEGTDRLTQGQSYADTCAVARNYCYVYRYDTHGRMVEKRMPGREAEYMVYNQGDQLVMSQDGNLRGKKQWMIHKYDAFGRITEQSLVTDAATTSTSERCEALQGLFDAGSTILLYDSAAATLVYRHVYDNYPASLDPRLAFVNVPSLSTLKDNRTVGLPTCEELALLSESGIDGYRKRVFYYDSKGRLIQTVECDNLSSKVLRISSRYDFAGNLLAQRESYTHDTTTDHLDRTFTYDARSRMTKETAQFNSGEQAVVNYTYDDLGQLTGKTYSAGTYAIHETLDYNIQGWLTEKSSELFEMSLRYYEPRRDWIDASYTGNITEWKWRHKLVEGTILRDDYTYAYTYDDMGRMLDSHLFTFDEDHLDNGVSGLEEHLTYDKNSNILTLNRSGSSAGSAQSYNFSYIGNQRHKETNSNRRYSYDANGNRTRDALTDFDLSYNILNLPEAIRTDGDAGIFYRYCADGQKVQASQYDAQYPYYYAGSLVYSDDGFESASFGGGRIIGTDNGTSSEVRYFLTDHLGSTRVVVKVTPMGRIGLDRKDYYPFGKEWSQSDMPTSDNRYTFSGKELQRAGSMSIDYHDFSARYYDPEGGIFLQHDPLSEKYYRIGQYNYCAGNPIRFADEDGRKIVDVKGQVLYQNGQWTKAASGTAAMRVGIAMMKTNIGTSIWNEMSDTKYDVTITLHEGNGPEKGELGSTVIHNNSDGEIIGMDVNIYKGSIEKQVEPQYSGEVANRLRPLSEEDRIGTIGVHEGKHVIDQTPQADKKTREANATKAEKRHVRELENKGTPIVAKPVLFYKHISFDESPK